MGSYENFCLVHEAKSLLETGLTKEERIRKNMSERISQLEARVKRLERAKDAEEQG